MRYRPFGRTGLQVSVVGFGCWPMAGDRYGAIEDDEAIRAIHRALDRGVNCVDTAPAYGAGHSEDVVARAQDWSTRMLALPPDAMALTRREARADLVRLFESGMETELDTVIANWWTPGTQATLRALVEKLKKKTL